MVTLPTQLFHSRKLAEVLVQAVMSLYRIQGRKSKLDQGHRKNLGYGLACIKGVCYHQYH